MRTRTHRFHQITGHARELEQARHIVLALHFHQRTDDLVHIAAGAEVTPGARDDDDFHVVGIRQIAERVAQLGIGLERQRILALGTVQRDRRNLAIQRPQEMLRGECFEIDAGRAKTACGVAHDCLPLNDNQIRG